MKVDWNACFKIIVTAIVIFLIINYWNSFITFLGLVLGAALPLILGGIIAYIANILTKFYERYFFPKTKKKIFKNIKRPVCIFFTFLSIGLLLFLLINMILPELISCVQILLDGIIKTVTNLIIWVQNQESLDLLLKDTNLLKLNNINLQDAISRGIDVLMAGVGGAMSSVVGIFSSVFGTTITIVVALIFSIYLLADKERLAKECNNFMDIYLGENIKNKTMYVLKNLDISFHNFIVGQCLEAVILGLLCIIGMWILRLPYASMIGCLVGFTALIPIVGAYIGAIVGAFMIFTVSPVQALIFLIFLIILQQLEGNIIYPKVVGNSIGLPGIWVLAAVTIGGGVLGIGGMLIGVPLAATIYKIVKKDMEIRSGKECR